MELKDFVKMVFERPDEYTKLRSTEKAKFFFMLQRFCSIMYPVQAQAFNHIKISQAESCDYWQESLSKLYKKTPGWVYTKTKKTDKKKADVPSAEAIDYYLERTRTSRRDLDDAVRLFGDQAYDPIRKIEAIMEE